MSVELPDEIIMQGSKFAAAETLATIAEAVGVCRAASRIPNYDVADGVATLEQLARDLEAEDRTMGLVARRLVQNLKDDLQRASVAAPQSSSTAAAAHETERPDGEPRS